MLSRLEAEKMLEFVRLGSLTKRYHTKHVIHENTVGHHSFGVAIIIYMLCPTASVNLIMAGLVHDLAEHITGDMSSPTKRMYPEMAALLHKLESQFLNDANLGFHETLSKEELRVLDMADKIDGMLYCIGELSLGNMSIVPIFNRYASYVEELKPTEQEYAIYAGARCLWSQYEAK